jgi:Aromatic-ring-opening dioxygenase LigAB, LigA subunit
VSTAARKRVNDLLARLFREPELLARLREDRERLFDEAGLDPEQRAALRDGSFGALQRIGVHPILRMHYQMAVNPALAGHVTIREFLPQLARERRDG